LDSFLASETLLPEENNLSQEQLTINVSKNTYQTYTVKTGETQEAFCFSRQVIIADACTITTK
jgi:hypothetical protein